MATGVKFQGLEAIKQAADGRRSADALAAVRRTRSDYDPSRATSHTICEETVRLWIFQNYPDAHLILTNDWGITLEVRFPKNCPPPPEGYAYKGGAARAMLQHSLRFCNTSSHVRDLDLIRVAAAEDQIDQSVAKRIMKEDHRFGHGIELISTFKQYFDTRDITQNEVIASRSRVIVSYTALHDSHHNILRPTEFAKTQTNASQQLISAKIIRIACEMAYSGNVFPTIQLTWSDPLELFPFLVHLDRALQRATRVADRYIGELATRGLTPSTLNSPQSLSDTLMQLQNIPNSAGLNLKTIVKSFPAIAANLQPSFQQKAQKRKVFLGA
ncbi:MAG: hypothetical protein KDD60_05450 [Bdellovibrionales bacterium]|nr:hypothetical protein [Bdellovibrionales bacterium]